MLVILHAVVFFRLQQVFPWYISSICKETKRVEDEKDKASVYYSHFKSVKKFLLSSDLENN